MSPRGGGGGGGADPTTRAIQDLTAGHKSALLLRQRFFNDANTDTCDDGEVRRLLERIILSFRNSITALESYSGDWNQAEEMSAPKVEEYSGESCKPSRLLAVRKGRRGCYKRRKGSESWTKVVPALMDDGRTWRKYGQKVILNAPFPRSYFRCTHKNDQGCLATKQVQQTQSDPPMYTINYDGRHTCTDSLKSPSSLFVDSSRPEPDSSAVLLSFNSAESDLYQGCCPLVPSEYLNIELLPESASNASSSNCSDLEQGMEFLQGQAVDMCVSDLDDFMSMAFEFQRN